MSDDGGTRRQSVEGATVVSRFRADAAKLREDLRDVSEWYSYARFERWRRQAVLFVTDWLQDSRDEIRALNEAADLQTSHDDPGFAISRCVRFLDDLIDDIVGRPANALTGASARLGRPELLRTPAASPPPAIAAVIQRLDKFADNLERLVADGGDDARFERWRADMASFLAVAISHDESRRFQGQTQIIINPYNQGYPQPDPQEEAASYIENLKKDLFLNPSLALKETTTARSQAVPAITKEGVFFAGQQFDALLQVQAILRRAKATIVIIDGYVGEDVLRLLTTKPPGVSVSILTKEEKPAFVAIARAFQKQHGGLGVRVSQAFHDRFVIVDDAEYYHFGHSLKDVGSKGFMFSRIEEPSIIGALAAQFTTEWAAAKAVL